MRKSENDKFQKPQWYIPLQRYILTKQKARALRLLDKVIEDDMPLFWADKSMQQERRLAWLYRIDLLLEWKRMSEALAWTCLECEVNPENITAKALKKKLKAQLRLDWKRKLQYEKKTKQSTKIDLWKGVAGMRELKAILERDVILPLQMPALYKKYRVNLPNGVLLHGPPGCGKTFIARKLAEILAFEFIEVKPSDLSSIYVHGSQQKIGELFEEARQKAPTLLFFDELDALVPDRGESMLGHHYSAEVNEFLVQLNECSKKEVLVIGATNLIKKIDHAVLRPGRMDKKVFIGPPDLEARVELLKLYMKDRPQEKIDWIKLAESFPLYSAAKIEYIINEAARMALSKRRTISEKDITTTFKSNPPDCVKIND